MSWKNIVITGLLCILAAPAYAQPGLSIDLVRGGGGLPVLDASGNWQWIVSVIPDESLFVNNAPNGVGGSMAIEIGLTFTGAPIVAGSAAVNIANFDRENFGNSPFAFGESPDDGVTVVGNQLFAALGSTYFLDLDANPLTDAPREVLTVKTAGPSSPGNLTTGVSWLGDYNTDGTLGGTNARIAQQGTNYNSFSGSITKTILGGDANLNGAVTAADFLILSNNINQAGRWQNGDFNGTATVTAADFLILSNNINQSLPAPGGGSVAGSAVPEPASVLLALLAASFVGVFRSRN